MRTETERTELKRMLYIQGGYILVMDSLLGETINPEFQAVDGNLYDRVTRTTYLKPEEQNLLSELKAGNKVSWGLLK